MTAILSLLFVAALSLLVTRIATVALMLTGLSRESARFQARSAFTGVGFTTQESESVVNHPVRRRIVMLLMLLGNIGIATVVATVILSILSTAESTHWGWYMLTLIAGIILLWAFATSRWVEHRMNKIITWCLTKWTRLDAKDYIALLQLQNGYAVTEMKVEAEDWLAGKSLQELALPREGVLVLGIGRSDGAFLGTPHADDKVMAGDVLVLYGSIEHLDELDQRRAGSGGEKAHHEAVVRQERGAKARRQTSAGSTASAPADH